MTKQKSTKKTLLTSVLSLVLCVAMLVGTTFAWFTDSVTSSNNKIVSGNLDIDLYLWNSATESVEITNESAPIFGSKSDLAQDNAADTLWEPGKTQVVYLSLKNNGSLDLKYKVAVDVENPVDGKNLYEVMQYAITENAKFDSVKSWSNGVDVVPGINTTQADDVVLGAGDEHFFALSVHMKETAGNEYMNGQVNFDIRVLATQLASEEDSFGSEYDALADYDGEISNAASLIAALSEGGNYEVIDSFTIPAGEIPTIPAGAEVALDLNGNTISVENETSDYALNNLGKLTIWDSNAVSTFSLRNTTVAGSINARGIYNGYDVDGNYVTTAELTVLGGTFNAMGTDGGAAIFNYGVANINGGTFNGNGGYTLNNRENGVMTVNNAVVTKGIYNLGTLVINNATVSNSVSGRHVVYNAGTLTINDGDFYNYNKGNATIFTANNCSVEINSGIYGIEKGSDWTSCLIDVSTGATAVINDGVFNGSVRSYGGNVTINNGTFSDPYSSGYLTDAQTVVTISGGTFCDVNSVNFASKYLAEGLVLTQNADGTYTIVMGMPVANLDELVEALKDAKDGDVIAFTKDITGDVVITQKKGIDITINGNSKKFTGIMTVYGAGKDNSRIETLTIKNINFVAKNGAESCIVSPDKTVYNHYSYSHNVTVENCTFTDPDGGVNCAAIRHEDGGDENWIVKGCTVDNTMHSIFQVNNVEGKLTVDGCTVKSKNGANLNSTTNLEMIGCNFDVKGYAVRFGVGTGGNLGTPKNYVIKNSTLKSICDDGDAVIMFRASAVDAVLTFENTVLDGTRKISGTTNATTINGSY